MCELFISADPQGWQGRTRSVRLHGVVTSIRLENLFWQVLEEIAARDDMGVVQLIEKLYDELITTRGEAGNFSSFLRVCALRYEALLAHQGVPTDVSVPLRSLDVPRALASLPPGWHRPGQAPQLPNSSFSSSARA